jgi:hypothetical protein
MRGRSNGRWTAPRCGRPVEDVHHPHEIERRAVPRGRGLHDVHQPLRQRQVIGEQWRRRREVSSARQREADRAVRGDGHRRAALVHEAMVAAAQQSRGPTEVGPLRYLGPLRYVGPTLAGVQRGWLARSKWFARSGVARAGPAVASAKAGACPCGSRQHARVGTLTFRTVQLKLDRSTGLDRSAAWTARNLGPLRCLGPLPRAEPLRYLGPPRHITPPRGVAHKWIARGARLGRVVRVRASGRPCRLRQSLGGPPQFQ